MARILPVNTNFKPTLKSRILCLVKRAPGNHSAPTFSGQTIVSEKPDDDGFWEKDENYDQP